MSVSAVVNASAPVSSCVRPLTLRWAGNEVTTRCSIGTDPLLAPPGLGGDSQASSGEDDINLLCMNVCTDFP